MSSARRLIGRLLVSAIALVASASNAYGATIFDPKYRFQSIETEHFVIYFHQNEGPQARRLGAIAEEVWHRLESRFGGKPPSRTHVVLADQAEEAKSLST